MRRTDEGWGRGRETEERGYTRAGGDGALKSKMRKKTQRERK